MTHLCLSDTNPLEQRPDSENVEIVGIGMSCVAKLLPSLRQLVPGAPLDALGRIQIDSHPALLTLLCIYDPSVPYHQGDK